MRYLLTVVLLLSVALKGHCGANSAAKDSLLRVLGTTTDLREQVRIYRNLADIAYDTPEETEYLRPLYKKAEAAGQTEVALEALSDIVVSFSVNGVLDSARYYFDIAERLVPREERDQWSAYLSMVIYYSEIQSQEKSKAVVQRLQEYRERERKKESLYRQVENAYTLGVIFLSQEKYAESVPYLATAVELAKKLPFKEGFRYQLLAIRRLAKAYSPTGKNAESIALLEEVIRLQERYFQLYYKDSRPFYPMADFYILIYTAILLNVDYMPQEQTEYYLRQLVDLCRDSDRPSDKYSCYLSLGNYYMVRGDWRNALVYNDSLIKYASRLAVRNLPSLYRSSSILYEELKDYPKALEYLKRSVFLKDSLETDIATQKLNELQVEYGMDRLNYEKSQLELKNKRLMVWGLLVVLVVVGGLCVYLYFTMRRERVMKEKMATLKLRAEESEKMKTAFVNSMCHEIRTPLNAIAGFSELVLDPSLDEETRAVFPQEIRRNTDELTSLIDGMLEVANLDVSDERLPCAPADVAEICRKGMEYLLKQDLPEVECRAELPTSPLVVQTNARYLLLLLEHLLDNAAKFTQQGSILLRCVEESDRVIVFITDTGCGIPEQMHQAVFDRFTKLDTYKQGSGLGLYLCRLIAKRLGGDVYIDPQYKSGTRMVVELPAE